MAKRKKTLLLGGAILVVLLGIMASVLILFGGQDDNNGSESSSAIINIMDESVYNIAKIEVENDLGGYVITQEEDGVFDVPDLDGFNVDQDNTKTAMSNVAVISANTLVTDAPDDLAQYGFDDPKAVVKVTLNDGKTYTLTIAEPAPTGMGNYVQLSGDDSVYLVSQAYMSRYYEKTKKDFVALTLHDYGDEVIRAKAFEIFRKDMDQSLKFAHVTSNASPDRPPLSDVYELIEPVHSYLSAENFKTFTQPITSVFADSVTLLHPTNEDLETYGFDDPEAIFVANMEEGVFTLTIGGISFKDNGDGTETQNGYYAIHSGIDAIFVLSVEEAAWVQADFSSTLAKVVYAPKVADLEQVVIEGGGGTYRTDITHTGEEAGDYTAQINGKDIDYDKFVTFYEYLISARAEDLYIGDPMEGEPKVTVTFTYTDTAYKDLVVELYDIGDRKAVICLDGVPKFTTRVSYLNNLLSNFELIANNQNIVTNY